jgi:hypothetical protein
MRRIRRAIMFATAVFAALLGTVLAAPQATAANTASISGTVREAGTGAPVAGVSVDLYRQVTRTLDPPFGNGRPFKTPGYVTSVETAANGTYTLSGLAASDAVGYWVCFGTHGLAYQPACYLDELGYDPFPDPLGLVQLPAAATPVHVSAGQHVTRIDASLIDFSVFNSATTGTVAGQVTQTVFGRPLKQVRVTVYGPGGIVLTEAMTGANGSYQLVFVPAGAGYHVCFDGSGAKGGLSLRGYTTSCRAASVAVVAGMTTANINAQLAGSI